MRKIESRVFVSVLCALGVQGAQAAGADAGALMRQHDQQAQHQQAERQQLQNLVKLAKKGGEDSAKKEEKKVILKSVRFTGATDFISDDELQFVVLGDIGKALSFSELEALAERVSVYLKDQGWFLARAYLPKQDITDGSLVVAISSGRLSKKDPVQVSLDAESDSPRFDRDMLQGLVENEMEAGSPLNSDTIDRSVLLIDDLPGVAARVRLGAGDEKGEVRILVSATEEPILSTRFDLDNYGSKSTGRERLNAGVTLRSPLGLGDQLNALITRTDGSDLGKLDVSFPFLSNVGWRVNAGFSGMAYNAVDGDSAGSANGNSQVAKVGLSYRWKLSKKSSFSVLVDCAQKNFEDMNEGSLINDKSVLSGTVGLNASWQDRFLGSGVTNLGFTLTSGSLELPDESSSAAINMGTDEKGLQTAGVYGKYGASFSRLQRFSSGISLYAGVNGQNTTQNLDSSEKFYLGGVSGVRAYSGSEAGGDVGAVAQLELRYDLPYGTPLGRLQLKAFYDTGFTVLNYDDQGKPANNAAKLNSYDISGAGLGMTLSRSGSHLVRAVIAAKLGSNPGRTAEEGLDADGSSDEWRLWLQFMPLL